MLKIVNGEIINSPDIEDIVLVDTLPVSEINQHKIYILSTNFSLNYYENSAWHLLGGSDQISIGNISPTDINKLWFDITTGSNPSLKYYNGTEWISASCVNVTSLNNIPIDYSGLSNGKGLFYNQVLNKWECADTTITGIVGSTQITTISDTTIASGSELVFNHPISTNIVPVIEEQIAGSTVIDTHLDFSDSNKYSLQDSGKIIFDSDNAKLDIYTKLLMHMDENTFRDECGHIITNTNVSYNTTNKVFGSGSAYFNGNSYLTITNSNDFEFGTSDFSIDMRLKIETLPTGGNAGILFAKRNVSGYHGFNVWISNTGAISVYATSNNTSWNILDYTSTTRLSVNQWYNIKITRNINNFYLIINGISTLIGSSTLAIATNTDNIQIGGLTDSSGKLQGYIDEYKIVKGLASTNIIIPTQQFGVPYSIANTPTYFQTTGSSNYSLTTIDTITSLTIPTTIPINTSIKCLFSVDNKVNWLYKDGTGIHIYSGDLTVDWINSNQWSEISTYFTNLPIETLIADLASLGVVPVTLDFAFQLNTTDLTVTPSISPITLTYITTPHNEFASIGSFSDSSTYGVKRVSNSQLSVKNKSAFTKIIKLNVITSA